MIDQSFARDFIAGKYDWQFGFIAVCLLVAFVIWLISRVLHRKAVEQVNAIASRVILNRWLAVEGAAFINRKRELESYVLRIRHPGDKTEMVIPFRPGHPSIRELQHMIQPGDTLEFRARHGKVKDSLDTELCAYIEICKIKHV